ncbi:MAG: Rrf2 family transcriptional regulator [Chitinophagales bacterium]|nr:Rrf2 family transcriptional regulator [Chitinophagales bacterium]
MFSKACEYGIKATIYISTQSKNNIVVSLKDVAKAINSPVAFTAKILQSLAKEQIINSAKGPNGGYSILEQDKKPINILQIVTAIDGDQIYNGCALGFENCSDKKPCPIHNQFKTIRSDLKEMLEKTTVNNLANEIEFGIACLKQ